MQPLSAFNVELLASLSAGVQDAFRCASAQDRLQNRFPPRRSVASTLSFRFIDTDPQWEHGMSSIFFDIYLSCAIQAGLMVAGFDTGYSVSFWSAGAHRLSLSVLARMCPSTPHHHGWRLDY